MDNTPALTFDRQAAQAWLCQRSDTEDGATRAESLGVDEDLTCSGMGGDFLVTIDAVGIWLSAVDSLSAAATSTAAPRSAFTPPKPDQAATDHRLAVV